jgi:hypothetical protein
MMEFAFRHLRGHWRLNLAVLLGLTLASALLASLPAYTAAISAQELSRSLEEASPAERSLLISGTLYTFRDELYDELKESLGTLLKDRLVIRHSVLPADPQQPSSHETDKPTVARLDVYSFDKLAENVRLVEGRLPEQVNLNQAVGNWLPPVEAVIGVRAAEQSGYAVGERLTASGMYHRLDIVGIVEPADPHDELWGGDLSAFVASLPPELGAGAIALPLIIAPESMQTYLGGPVFPHELAWRVTLNTHRIGPHTAELLRANLVNFQTQTATRGGQTSTGLGRILAGCLARLAGLRVALWLLTAQSLIVVLYTLTLFGSSIVDRLQETVAMLSARGASAWQISRIFALENLLLALPAALLMGPGLAQAVVYLWGESTSLASGETWLLSAIAASLGWLALLVPLFVTARRCSHEAQPTRTRPPQQSVLHKRYVDLYLLAFGGLLVWQLNRSGSFLARTVAGSRLGNSSWADPLLLLGPLLLLVALAMIFQRAVPFLLRLAARPFEHQRGLVPYLGLLRPARHPLPASRMVLLVGLTVSMVSFATILSDALSSSQPALRSRALVHGIAGAFQLNALMLALFGVAAFFLAQLLAAQGREHEWDILQVQGLAARQWSILTVLEGSLVLGLGLLVGALTGLGLSYTIIPYLSQSLAGVTIERVVVDWPAVTGLYAVLVAMYGSALALVCLLMGHGQARRAAWREDE